MLLKKYIGATIACLLLSTAYSQAEEALDANEVAKELANPNTPLASMIIKFQYRTFKGDLPDANDQDGTTMLFQPVLPFALDNGDKIIFRPAIPFIADQPVFDSDNQGFSSESGVGDVVFDLVYAKSSTTGLLTAGGIIASVPTATEDTLGTDRWTVGPEFFVGKLSQDYIAGLFPSHQWDVAGSGDKDINLTTIQAFGVILPGGGWNYGSSPIMNYDWESEEWTVPVNLTFGRTVIFGKRPWKISMEMNYYVEQPDAFGPEWMIGINITPVVENMIANWL